MSEKKQSLRVLVVDDEMLQRKIVSRQLAELGFTSDDADTAAKAIELLQNKDFDVILLDIQMSDLSGLEVLPLIKKLEDAPEVIMLILFSPLVIIALTAHTLAGEREKCLMAGMNDYLPKPVKIRDLATMLEYWHKSAKPLDEFSLLFGEQLIKWYFDTFVP